jgi:glycosyltransferase involved in cell wall biosynthesis
MTLDLSVILCSHNPRADYLQRAIDALKVQSLSRKHWEFIIIDNRSETPISSFLDALWHPSCRILVESELGILPARVRGLREAKADHMLFIDDDNVLSPDYLETALKIGKNHSFLGAWGAGQIELEYETAPPNWVKEFEYLFTALNLKEEQWANVKFDNPVMPPTMGMCLRRAVAEKFLALVESDPRRKLLGRRGKNQFFNCEDHDLALCACDLNLATGQFPELAFHHLISSNRVNREYLLRLYQGTFCSHYILSALRGRNLQPDGMNSFRRIFGSLRRRLLMPKLERQKIECGLQAKRDACKIVADWDKSKMPCA